MAKIVCKCECVFKSNLAVEFFPEFMTATAGNCRLQLGFSIYYYIIGEISGPIQLPNLMVIAVQLAT